MLGLKRGTVSILPHDPKWVLEGERYIGELREILGDIAIDIRHVGSTSIPAIPAKPIIDIALAVQDPDDIMPMLEKLEASGYYLRPDSNTRGQLLLARGSLYDGTGDLQTHFIHVVRVNRREGFDYLNFRSYLNVYREIAEKYAELKLRLARDHSTDRASYTAEKSDFIREILLKASLYYGR